MSAPTPDQPATTSTAGFADGLGRRTLVFDRQCGTTAECLVVRPELGAFEESLRQRLSRVSSFEDERFARVREVVRDAESGRVTVVSEFVAGERLAHLLEDAAAHARDESAAPSIDVAIGFLVQALSALGALHATAGLTHGAVAPGTTLVTPAGQVVFTDYVYAQALQRLRFTRMRLWHEFGVAMPPGTGPARFDVAADLGQATLSAVMLALGRPLARTDYPNRLAAALMDVAEIAQIRADATFADTLRRLFERMLPLPGRRPFGAADDAIDELTRIARSAMGVNACRDAFAVFATEMAGFAAGPPAPIAPAPASESPSSVFARLSPRPEETAPVVWEGIAAGEPPRIEVPDEAPAASDVRAPAARAITDTFEPPPDAATRTESAAEPAAEARVETTQAREPDPVPERGAADRAAQVATPAPEAQPEAPAAAAVSETPSMAGAAEPEQPAQPSPRRRRGRGVRDKLRSWRAPAAKPAVTVAPPAPVPPAPPIPPPPAPVIVAAPPAPPPAPPPPPIPPPPVPPVVLAAPPPPPPAVPPPAPRPYVPAPEPSPYLRAVHAQNWQPSPVTVPVAPPAVPPSPAPPAQAVTSAPKPIPLSTLSFDANTVRLKSEPPRGYTPKYEPRGFDEHIAARSMEAGAATTASRFPWKFAAAAAIVVAAGLFAGRAYLSGGGAAADTRAAATAPPASTPAVVSPASKTGTLVLETEPAGARVLVDGAAAGETPLTLSDLSAGRHVLTFVTSTATVRRAVRVEAGRTLTLKVPVYSGFVAILAPIVLHISEGGRAIGTTEQGPLMLSPGRHELTLTNRQLGYTGVQIVDIEPGQEFKLTVDPRGPVNLNAVPWAEVFIDGVRAGETPIANLQVPLGTREFIFKHPQFGERKITTTVMGNVPAAVSIDFTKPSYP